MTSQTVTSESQNENENVIYIGLEKDSNPARPDPSLMLSSNYSIVPNRRLRVAAALLTPPVSYFIFRHFLNTTYPDGQQIAAELLKDEFLPDYYNNALAGIQVSLAFSVLMSGPMLPASLSCLTYLLRLKTLQNDFPISFSQNTLWLTRIASLGLLAAGLYYLYQFSFVQLPDTLKTEFGLYPIVANNFFVQWSIFQLGLGPLTIALSNLPSLWVLGRDSFSPIIKFIFLSLFNFIKGISQLLCYRTFDPVKNLISFFSEIGQKIKEVYDAQANYQPLWNAGPVLLTSIFDGDLFRLPGHLFYLFCYPVLATAASGASSAFSMAALINLFQGIPIILQILTKLFKENLNLDYLTTVLRWSILGIEWLGQSFTASLDYSMLPNNVTSSYDPQFGFHMSRLKNNALLQHVDDNDPTTKEIFSDNRTMTNFLICTTYLMLTYLIYRNINFLLSSGVKTSTEQGASHAKVVNKSLVERAMLGLSGTMKSVADTAKDAQSLCYGSKK